MNDECISDLYRRRFLRLVATSLFALSAAPNLIERLSMGRADAAVGYRPVSYLRTEKGKTFVVANGQPYLMYGIQLRIDHIIWNPTAQTDWTRADHYFERARAIGFRTVVVPAAWSYIEQSEGNYQFAYYVDKIIESADKYDLSIQLLWYGSDVCGYNFVPPYVRNDRVRFPRTAKYDTFYDLSSPSLIKAESAALSALMNRLADIDIHNRVIMIQIENEPDGAGDLVNTVNWGDSNDKAAKMFAGSQFDAAAALMNTLGDIVHRSRRNVVTRCNVGTPYRSLDLYLALRQAGTGLDIVGVDTYSDDPKTTKSVLTTIPVETVGNVSHQPEGDATAPNLINLVLSDFEEGGGFLIYDLIGLYRGSESADPSTWSGRDGLDKFRSFNQLVYKADKMIAVTPKGKSAAFNVAGNAGNWKEQRTVGTTLVTFETSNGGAAFAIQDINDDLILMNLTDGGEFTLDLTHTRAPAVSLGSFDQNNIWREQGKKAIVDGTLTLSAGDVARIPVKRT